MRNVSFREEKDEEDDLGPVPVETDDSEDILLELTELVLGARTDSDNLKTAIKEILERPREIRIGQPAAHTLTFTVNGTQLPLRAFTTVVLLQCTVEQLKYNRANTTQVKEFFQGANAIAAPGQT
jgi:hypothetical protein